MKKVKKMAFGGMGKQPANALRPMPTAAPKPLPAFVRPYADKMIVAGQQAMQKGGAKFGPDPGYIQQLKQMTPSQRQQKMAYATAQNAAETQRVNQFNARTPAQRQQAEIARTSGTIGGTVGRALGLGKKKGGAVKKKATKK